LGKDVACRAEYSSEVEVCVWWLIRELEEELSKK
jgi:hypothetical protein